MWRERAGGKGGRRAMSAGEREPIFVQRGSECSSFPRLKLKWCNVLMSLAASFLFIANASLSLSSLEKEKSESSLNKIKVKHS